MRLFVLLVALLAATAAAAAACPVRCECSVYAMDCDEAGLTQPPVGYWPKVQHLHLDRNGIAELYEYSFSGFPNVDVLSLAANNLTTLDASWFAPLTPNALTVAANQISSVAESGRLPTLTVLDLNANSLTELDPDVFQRIFPNLKTLSLGCNDLRLTADRSFLNHYRVEALRLANVDASQMGAATFQGLPFLEDLDIEGANVTDISEVFVGLNKLKRLGLTHNNIAQVEEGALPPARALETLNLAGNPLQRLDLRALSDAMGGGAGAFLDVSSSPLACACAFDSLFWWAEGRGVWLEAGCPAAHCAIARVAPRTLLPTAAPRLATPHEPQGPRSRDSCLTF